MKSTLFLVLAAAAATAMPAARAQSSVTITGYAEGGVLFESGGAAGSVRKLGSGISGPTRLIFRGQEDLGGGLAAFFHLESGVLFDTGGSLQPNFFGRQSFVGLSGGFGTLRLGLDYTPIFITLNGVADPFRTAYAGSAGNIFTVGSPAGPKSVGFPNASAVTGTVSTGAISRANTLHYLSPVISGFSGEAAYSFGEQVGDSEKLRTLGLSAGYSAGPLNVRLAWSDTRNAAATDRARNILLAGNYDFGPLRLYSAYGTNKGYGTADSVDTLVGVSVPFGVSQILASYAAKNDKSAANADAHQVGLGYLYYLSKRTHLHASVARMSNKVPKTWPAFYTIGTPAGPGSGDKLFAVGFGHFF